MRLYVLVALKCTMYASAVLAHDFREQLLCIREIVFLQLIWILLLKRIEEGLNYELPAFYCTKSLKTK